MSLSDLRRELGAGPPLPPHWGGWRIAPLAIELWQARESRLHDRILYLLEDGRWRVRRLAP